MRRILLLVAILMFVPAAAYAGGSTGTTSLTYSPGHGTQVEFLKQGGAAYLWYPGNQVVLHGQWQPRGRAPAQQMCFKYGPHTYNPVTHVYGDVWECENVNQYVSTLMEQQQGDVFGLSHHGAVPFVLSPSRATMAQLAARAGAHPGAAIPLRK